MHLVLETKSGPVVLTCTSAYETACGIQKPQCGTVIYNPTLEHNTAVRTGPQWERRCLVLLLGLDILG